MAVPDPGIGAAVRHLMEPISRRAPSQISAAADSTRAAYTHGSLTRPAHTTSIKALGRRFGGADLCRAGRGWRELRNARFPYR